MHSDRTGKPPGRVVASMESTKTILMTNPAVLDRVRIVLVRTSHPGNIGAAARAMKTMGLGKLYLVDPVSFPDPVADARASGATDLLVSARVVPTLADALEGTVLSAALTARRREWSIPVGSAREVVPELLRHAASGEIALVFGTENSGLTNDEVGLCSLPVQIPANPEYSSLNLGSAVQLMCYELRLAAGATIIPAEADQEPATFEEIESFYRHLEHAMTQSGFYDPRNPKKLLPRVRRLFGRIRLEHEEINILRGILSALERKPD